MKTPEFKVLPCVICTIGFNSYVAGHKLFFSSRRKIANLANDKKQPTQINKIQIKN